MSPAPVTQVDHEFLRKGLLNNYPLLPGSGWWIIHHPGVDCFSTLKIPTSIQADELTVRLFPDIASKPVNPSKPMN
jgi:hypothetical protein